MEPIEKTGTRAWKHIKTSMKEWDSYEDMEDWQKISCLYGMVRVYHADMIAQDPKRGVDKIIRWLGALK